MFFENINFPIFIKIGDKILSKLSKLIKEENFNFENVVIFCGNTGQKFLQKFNLEKQFKRVDLINIRKIGSFSSLKSEVIKGNYDLIISIGGGYINDIAKYISTESLIPLISIPTTLSNDGIVSPVSILRLNNKYRSIGTVYPIGVIGDIEIIKKSPKMHLLSGLGDLMSNISAYFDWILSSEETGEKINNIALNISYYSAISILYNFKLNKYDALNSDSFIIDLFYGLVLSGISMIIAKSSRPASGSEHNISHALDEILGDKNNLHGLQVGYSTLFTLYLHKKYKILEDLIKIYKFFDFPLSLEKLNIDEKIFLKAIKLAKRIRNRYTILSKYDDKSLEKEFLKFKREVLK